MKCRERCVSVQEMAGHDDCTERGEAEENDAEGGVDEAEEGRADAVGHEANDEDQRGEPGHEPGGDHQDSHRGALEPKMEWAKGSQLAVTPTQ